MKQIIRTTICTLIILITTILIPIVGEVKADQPIQILLPDRLDWTINKLASCESGQIPDVRIIDSNGKYSTGWLQFQDGTFNYFGEKYGLPHDDIWSPEQQIAIAKEMIKEGIAKYHWKICWSRL